MIRDGSDPLFEGAFSVLSRRYHVGIVSDDAQINTPGLRRRMVIYHDSPNVLQQINGADGASSLLPNSTISLYKRQYIPGNVDLTDSIGSKSGCPTTRRVAIVGIATDCKYTAAFDSAEEIRQSLINMVNTASEVYEDTFNIALAIHNLTISDATCPSNTSNSIPWNVDCLAGDLNWRLQQFSSWRRTLDDRTNAYWTLMTGCPNGGEVGISWTGELCNSQMSTNVVARTENAWQVFA